MVNNTRSIETQEKGDNIGQQFSLYNEDCLVALSRIPDDSVDMVMCDLPYG